MNNNYNSILKEKKKYEEPIKENKHKYFKRSLLIGLFISILIIIISYIIYYNTILSSESIFLNNTSKLINNYSSFFEPLIIPISEKSYNIHGDVDIDNFKYNYAINSNNNKLLYTLNNQINSTNYYYDGVNGYIKSSKIGDYYSQNNIELYTIEEYYNLLKNLNYERLTNITLKDIYNITNYNNNINTIKNNYNNFSNIKYIKKFYFIDKLPIVEVNISLDKDAINKILENSNLQFTEDIAVNITMKNEAITNKIKDIKIIINNKSKKMRRVLEYKDNIIYYSDSKDNKYNFTINKLDNTEELKIYKDDELYSVLTLNNNLNNYDYTYKIIDKYYTINLSIIKTENNYEFNYNRNIDNKINNVKFTLEYSNSSEINEIIDANELQELTEFNKNLINSGVRELLS